MADTIGDMKAKASIIEDVAAILKCSTEQVPEKVEQLVARHDELQRLVEEEKAKNGDGNEPEASGEDA